MQTNKLKYTPFTWNSRSAHDVHCKFWFTTDKTMQYSYRTTVLLHITFRMSIRIMRTISSILSHISV